MSYKSRKEKAERRLQEFEFSVDSNSCYCQDEGSYEVSYGICPIHFPHDPKELRKIVMYFAVDAYERGLGDAIMKTKDFLDEIDRSEE